MRSFKIILNVVIALLLIGQGSMLYAMSTDMKMQVSKGDGVQLSNLDDFNFGALTSLGKGRIKVDDVCVFSTTGAYKIRVTGQHLTENGRNLQVADGAGNLIRYNTFWRSGDQLLGPMRVHRSYDFTGADQADPNCGASGTNAELEIRVLNKTFKEAPDGLYTDVLTVIVEAI